MDNHTLHLSLSWFLLPLALFLTVLGASSSPCDAQGRPLLLLPDVKAVEDYRRSMSSALREHADCWMVRLLALLAGAKHGSFTQSRQAQAAFQHAFRIAPADRCAGCSTGAGRSARSSSRHNHSLPRSTAFSLALGEPT